MITGLGRSPGEGIGYHSSILGLPLWITGKKSACSVGDLGSIPELGRYTWRRERLPTLYHGLEKSMEKSMGLQRVITTEQLSLFTS